MKAVQEDIRSILERRQNEERPTGMFCVTHTATFSVQNVAQNLLEKKWSEDG